MVLAPNRADLLVLVTAMVPAPRETPNDWSANTGFDEVMGQQGQRYSGADLFYQDVPPALAEEVRRKARDQSGTPGHAPWPLDAWPPVATRLVLCTEDRFFSSVICPRNWRTPSCPIRGLRYFCVIYSNI
jgi:hypothetical protein